jgi:K+-transporting ATPase ATPase B chain
MALPTRLVTPKVLQSAALDALRKLDPRHLVRNPVMFVTEVGSAVTTFFACAALVRGESAQVGLSFTIAGWLWFTVLFANFAEAVAEGRGKAQAEALRRGRSELTAKRLRESRGDAAYEEVPSGALRRGDAVVVEAGEVIPCDGEVVEGVASVDESVITGESAPVIRESGGDRSAVTGGTRVLSDRLVVRITSDPGNTFLDRMIAMVEGAKRQKTPNEIALTVLLAGLTLLLLFATVTLLPFSAFAVRVAGHGAVPTVAVLAGLLVCLIPTTIGGLLSAIGIAGMDRLIAANVVATSGRAVEAAGDVDVLLLDKTGTITLGNRQAAEFLPAPRVEERTLADAAQLASLADETPEGRSIVVLAKQRFAMRGREVTALGGAFVPFSAATRMSGVNLPGRTIRKGSVEAIEAFVAANGGPSPPASRRRAARPCWWRRARGCSAPYA